jgi:tetratricopeptide (TPR) repeat protein
MIGRFAALVTVLMLLRVHAAAQWLPEPEIDERIQTGIGAIYNLDFDEAAKAFDEVVRIRPDHPVGYFFLAMTEWWRILIKLEDESHDKRFFGMLDRVITMCDRRLDSNPNDVTALFFKGGAIGFRGRLRANRGSWFLAARDGVVAMPIVRKAYQLDPNNFDVLLGIGIYNYYAEVIPSHYPLVKPLMTFFPSGDKKKGLEQLILASQHAKYAHIEAAYFMMQNYFHYEKEYGKALELARSLHKQFPRNPVFHRYLGRCLIRQNFWEDAAQVFGEVEKRHRAGDPGYDIRDAREAAYYLGRFQFMAGNYDEALRHLTRCDELSKAVDKGNPSGFQSMANLTIGMIYDVQLQRSLAVAQYRKVLKMKEFEHAHTDARKYLNQPYTRF